MKLPSMILCFVNNILLCIRRVAKGNGNRNDWLQIARLLRGVELFHLFLSLYLCICIPIWYVLIHMGLNDSCICIYFILMSICDINMTTRNTIGWLLEFATSSNTVPYMNKKKGVLIYIFFSVAFSFCFHSHFEYPSIGWWMSRKSGRFKKGIQMKS